jgi:hypothetical protein
MTNQRADRFTEKLTKLARDAQLSKESKERIRRFRLRVHVNRRMLRQLKETA